MSLGGVKAQKRQRNWMDVSPRPACVKLIDAIIVLDEKVSPLEYR